MRLKISRSKNSASFYVTKTVYIDGKEKTITVEKLGTEKELLKTLNGEDPVLWAKNYVAELNQKEQDQSRRVLVPFSQAKQIKNNEQRSFNGGYLFLQEIYHALGLHHICKEISDRHSFKYNLDAILSRLIYGRILFPSSKLSTAELSKKFMEQPEFDLHQIYRALSVISKESDFIQKALYQNSLQYANRKTGVIYYDCTNYFFEIEEPDIDGDRQYGKSKENRPNPIVQMGLFMDGDGIPLAFNINPGNTNEQITLQPLEKKLVGDFGMSKFIVCTDAGLASANNRKFNDKEDRAFITTQSLKILKDHLKKWALSSDGWSLVGSDKLYNLDELDTDKDFLNTYYKERWINEDGLEQKMIVTYSLKYKNYQEKIRNGQIERAQKAIDFNKTKLKKKNANDFRRFVDTTTCTNDGEVATKTVYSINNELIVKEAKFDGFYAVCTNLEGDTNDIIKINHRRYEIEECFKIMKSEFKARPVYLQRQERIQAHFMTCFLALVIFRYLEKKLDEKYTCPKIISTLEDMDFFAVKGEGYVPTYTRTEVTDALHESFGFRTDYEIVSTTNMKKIFKQTKSQKKVRKKSN